MMRRCYPVPFFAKYSLARSKTTSTFRNQIRSFSSRDGFIPFQGSATLNSELYSSSTSSDGTPKKTALVLHGMLGSHKNLRQISYRLADTFPEYQMLMVTLRGHGDSSSGEPPHTVASCARDLFNHFHEKGLSKLPDVMIGHSFGGKVTLEILEQQLRSNAGNFSQDSASNCFILDSVPSFVNVKDSSANDSVAKVISTLRKLKLPFTSKDQMIEEMINHGLPLPIAQWMTLNIRRSREHENNFIWSFDLDVIESLLHDYCNVEYWPLLESDELMQSSSSVTFVQASKNPVWTPEIVGHLDKIDGKTNGRVKRTLLKDAGHWVHVDQPDLLFQILSKGFQ